MSSIDLNKYLQSNAALRVRRLQFVKEKVIEVFLFACAFLSVIATTGIVWILISESIPFFKVVSLKEFLTSTEWTPLFSEARYGILPLLSGTLITTLIATSIAIPIGLFLSLYLSEFVSARKREVLKPVLEMLAAVPTVVYGYFALLFVTPLLAHIFPDIAGFNTLSAGLVMGIMIIPYICSLAEDAIRAVPQSLREASLALGASRWETAFKVILPSASSGVTAALLLGISRALGETMVVAIAAGMQPQIAWNPLEPSETITAYIVQVSLGDLPHGSIGYQTIYAAGLMLFILSLVFNSIGLYFKKRHFKYQLN